MQSQRGVSLFLVAVILILVIGAILAFLALAGKSRTGANTSETTDHLAAVQAALEQFAGATGRLPCPANPALDTGDASPVGASATCDFPAGAVGGTVPWRTIGLRREDSLDAWGWKVSYRVYTGAAGSLTQDQGASMVLCTTDLGATSPGPGPGNVCQQVGVDHTKASEYLVGKGLSITDFGTIRTDVAYVLVSHGPSGLGGYTSAGIQTPAPNSAAEIANTSATGPFMAMAASDVNDPASVNHFDDVLAYRELPDFVARAKLAARLWPGNTSLVLNTATVSAAAGHAVSYGDLGQQTLNFGGSTVSVQAAGTAENLSFDAMGGTEGIGGAGGGNTLSSANAEVLRVDFHFPAEAFALTLDGFGCRTLFGFCLDLDRAQLTFYKDDVQVGSPVTVLACNSGDGLASFSIDLGASPGGDFNRVDVAPLSSIPLGTPTTVLVSEFKTCVHGAACVTSLDTGSGPGGNHCP